jgi:hypothetical protein
VTTANKRASSFIDACGILFPPDGTINFADRAWLLGQYSGVAAEAVSTGPLLGESIGSALMVDSLGVALRIESMFPALHVESL